MFAVFGHEQLVEVVADLVCQTASGQILTGKRTQRAIAQECRAFIVRCDLVVPGDSGGYGRQKRGGKGKGSELLYSPFQPLHPPQSCLSVFGYLDHARKSERPRAASPPGKIVRA